jgi:hypothetical protein
MRLTGAGAPSSDSIVHAPAAGAPYAFLVALASPRATRRGRRSPPTNTAAHRARGSVIIAGDIFQANLSQR